MKCVAEKPFLALAKVNQEHNKRYTNPTGFELQRTLNKTKLSFKYIHSHANTMTFYQTLNHFSRMYMTSIQFIFNKRQKEMFIEK